MSGINSILNIASSSLAAQQVALSVTSENISNVNTPGYSRQRAVIETAPVTNTNGLLLGNGVQVNTVQRFYDATLQKNITDSNSSLQNNQSTLTSLQQIEPAFNEITTNGLGKSIQDFFSAWQTLSANAGGTSERQTVLTDAQVMVDNFNQANDSLRTVQASANTSLAGITADITLKAKNIAALNAQISQTEQGGLSANELRDQRDTLAQDLAKDMGGSFTEQRNGTMSVQLADGRTLVDGSSYATVYTTPKPLVPPDVNNVNPGNHILITAIGNPPSANNPLNDADITATIGGPRNSLGQVGAMLNMRDTVVPAYLQKLDELAYNIANQVNTQHKQGWNLNNAVGSDFFSVTGAPDTLTIPATAGLNVGDAVSGPGIPSGTTITRIDSATQLTLSPTLLQSIAAGTTFTFTPAVGPATQQTGSATGVSGYSSNVTNLGISLNISTTNEIAAADTNPLTGGSGNNGNALAIAAIANQTVPFTTDNGASSSVITYYNAMVSGIGLAVQTSQNSSDMGESYVTQLTNLRDSNSGVSLDEEMTNMLKYQKAYQGAAKMITTATELMDTVLALVQ